MNWGSPAPSFPAWRFGRRGTDCKTVAGFTPTLRQRLEYAGLSALVWLIGCVPFRGVRWIANGVGALVYVLDRRGREVALANLDAAFGDRFTPHRKKQIARGSYQTFARTMLELFWSPRLNAGVAARIATFEGLEKDPCHHDPKQAVVYLCLHFSNFEWLSQFAAYSIGNGPVVTQHFKNPLIERIFNRLRSSTGHEVIPQERAMIRMLKHLKGGGKFAMLCDLNLDPGEAAVVIETFGGLKISVTQMQAALALRTKARIVPVECHPQTDGRYRMVYHPPLEYPPEASAGEITQLCWNVLEPSLFEHPECWLWAYKHWRYRPVDDDTERYPFYANVAKRFDKLLKKQNRANERSD
jgi:Kdo2-lipid IVA lauroyltransferase/acyltransferase